MPRLRRKIQSPKEEQVRKRSLQAVALLEMRQRSELCSGRSGEVDKAMNIPDSPWVRETEARGTDYMYEYLGFEPEGENDDEDTENM